MHRVLRSLICMGLCLAMLVTMPAWASAATAENAAAQPRFSYTGYTTAGLSITSKGMAYCSCDAEGYEGITTKIHIDMKLQQYIALQWTTIAVWEGTFNDVWGGLSKTKQVYTGRYRVKATFTVYSGSAYETIEMYSQEKYATITTS